uniref:Uncharacterized protein n=1 Tax=Sus scrofa TaxID=9823 RepID=F1RW61_PIG
MLSGARGRLALALRGTRAPPSAVARRCLHASGSRPSADENKKEGKPPRAFDPALLEFLVCHPGVLRCHVLDPGPPASRVLAPPREGREEAPAEPQASRTKPATRRPGSWRAASPPAAF